MNEQENLEAELRRLKPAAPPQDLMARLAAISPPADRKTEVPAPQVSVADSWRQLLRWLIPAAAGAALVIAPAILWPPKPGPESAGPGLPQTAETAVKPNAVQVDRELVAAYDALAELPGGEPVRFRCQEWMDSVVMRDAESGLLIEQRTPRFEIVAARLDTF
jgi:hypothetical protein